MFVGTGRGWRVRAVPVACLIAVVLVLSGLTWWLLSRHTRGAEIAGVLALPVGIMAVAVPVYQSRIGDRAGQPGATAVITAEVNGLTPVSGRDAHLLGVQRARLSGAAQAPQGLGLTPYLPRIHDLELQKLIAAAAGGGPSVLAVLVGDSTIGKTRALYEALSGHEHVSRWPLALPADAGELDALLREASIGSETVLWLDEIQKYLFGISGAKAARSLSRLLSATRQIVVVGTIWRAHLTELTARGRPGDPNADARILLQGPRTRQIVVPDHLTADQRLTLASDDPRLVEAATMSGEDGRVIQHLTGGPELLDAYDNGGFFTPVEHALITAAIDARRLGHYQPISGELLAAAADGYLSPGQRPGGANWAATALTSLTSGNRPDGSSTDIRTLTALRTHRTSSGQPDPRYEPDDFLDQHVSDSRQACLSPAAFWDALAEHAALTDLYRLGEAAYMRGLYRYAALLWRRAAADGDVEAAIGLIKVVSRLGAPAAHDVCMWVAEHAPLDDPWCSGELVNKLDELGATEAIAAFIARDPVACIPPDDLAGSGHLLTVLWRVGATAAIAALLARDPAARFPLGSTVDDNIYDLLDLLTVVC